MDNGHWSGRVKVLRLAGGECDEREKKSLGRKRLLTISRDTCHDNAVDI